MSTWKVSTDGGCPSNPGPGAFAFVIDKTDTGGDKVAMSGFLPMATNNQAEYRAVNAAFWYLLNRETELPNTIEIWSDSQLIVNQLNQHYAVKDEILRPFYAETFSALSDLRKRTRVSINWFRRENNTEADELCNIVLEGHGIEIVSKRKGRSQVAALPK